jgi:hypothetical protein
MSPTRCDLDDKVDEELLDRLIRAVSTSQLEGVRACGMIYTKVCSKRSSGVETVGQDHAHSEELRAPCQRTQVRLRLVDEVLFL